MIEKYYSVSEISEILHKQNSTVRRMIAKGEFGNTLNNGKDHLVPESQVKEYIKNNTGLPYYQRPYSSKTHYHAASKPAGKLKLDF